MAITIREVTDPSDPAIERWADLRVRVTDVGEGTSWRHQLPLLVKRTPLSRSFLIVAERNGSVIGGTTAHYLYGTRTAYCSLIAVDPAARVLGGVGRRLRDAGFAICQREAGDQPHQGMFAEIADPAQRPRFDEHEAAERHRRWRLITGNRYGFKPVRLPLLTPGMRLVYAPPDPAATSVASAIVIGSLHGHWLFMLGQDTANYYLGQLRALIGNRTEIELG